MTIDYQLRYHDGLPEHLLEKGWEVHIASGEGPISTKLSHIRGVTKHTLKMAREPNPGRDLLSLFRWARLVRQVRPDVLFVGTPKASLLGLFAGKLLRVPHRVYMVHGLRAQGARGLKAILLRKVEQFTCMLATVVVPVSYSLQRSLLDLRIVDSPKIMVIGAGSCNGIDLRKFSNRAGRTDGDSFSLPPTAEAIMPVIGFVGRLTADKGLGVLADALQILKQKGIGVTLLLVGPVDDKSGEKGVQLLRATGQAVQTTGELEDTADSYRSMDVFCLPSRREGLPNVVLEAFASGVPVVATAATGIIDLVVNAETGFLAEIDCPQDLANALSAALFTDTCAIVSAARELVRVHYARPIVLNNQVRFLDGLIGVNA